jgi:hypothetical protein
MSEMGPNDYQLVRIAVLASISARAAELGQEIYDEGADTIDDLRAALAERDARIAKYATKAADLDADYRTVRWRRDQVVPSRFEDRILELGIMASADLRAATPEEKNDE